MIRSTTRSSIRVKPSSSARPLAAQGAEPAVSLWSACAVFPSVGEMHPAPNASVKRRVSDVPRSGVPAQPSTGGASKRSLAGETTTRRGGTTSAHLPLRLARELFDRGRPSVPAPSVWRSSRWVAAAADRCPRGALGDHSRPALGRRPSTGCRRSEGVRPPPHGGVASGRPAARSHPAAGGLPGPRPGHDAGADLPDHHHRAAEADGAQPPARLRLRDPRPRPLPCQRLLPARVDRSRVPHHPDGHQEPRGARPAVEPPRVHRQASRPRARHRADRLGQVHHAGLADRRDQPDPHRSHRHDRGPDRVPAPPQAVHRQPARDRARRHVVLGRAARQPCVRTPT